VLLIETGTLTRFVYLEHGAFYAIFALAMIMFMESFVHIPDAIAGLPGAAMIALAWWSSIRHDRKVVDEPYPEEVL